MKAAIYHFEPKFCPVCGIRAVQQRDKKYGHARYNLRNSFTCDCGLVFERVSTDALVGASIASEGNLHEKLAQGNREGDSDAQANSKRVA